MARATTYHVCAAAAVLLAVLFSSLLYAHQLAPGHGLATSPVPSRDKGIAARDALDALPPRVDTPIHDTRDEILNGKIEIPSLDFEEDSLKPKGKVVIPSEYKKAVKKGELLLCYMKGEASPGAKGTSAWQEFEQLDQWGWKQEAETGDDNKDYSHVVEKCTNQIRLQDVISSDLTGGKQRKWIHSAESNNGGVIYHATNAEYKNQYWPEKGVMIADSNYGAEYMIAKGKASKNPWDNLPMPKLKQWSDVNYLTWQDLTSTSQRQNLK